MDGATGHPILNFLDVYSCYNQIKMHPQDREKTTFRTDSDNFYYEVMSFGLKNAGATYQRLMDYVFNDMIGRNIEVYVDDIVGKSDSCEQHFSDLREVFQSLRKYRMRLNPDKCAFGVEGGKFLGFMLTYRGIEANPEKCKAIAEIRSPHNLKEIQQLVGRLTSLSRFVPKLAERMRPIIQLFKKTSRFEWTAECERNFLQLKAFLASPPVIQKPNTQELIIIYLVILNEAISSVLVQEIEVEERLVYFVSRVLHGAEIRYQMVEKVGLAFVITARRMRMYFQNHRVIVKTNYLIMKILTKPDLARRMIGWPIQLSEFHIQYQPRVQSNLKPLSISRQNLLCNQLRKGIPNGHCM